MLFLNRLPRLYHPLLKHRRFGLVTHDRYFLVVETTDPRFSVSDTRKLLDSLHAASVEEVKE
jgi:hypothetical protein